MNPEGNILQRTGFFIGLKNPQQIIFINSLCYCLLAYYTVILLTNTFSILLAGINGFDGTLYYYGFQLASDESTWSKDLSFLIFFIGIGFSFLLGLLFEWLYRKSRKHVWPGKMFFLWGYIFSFSYFFGNIIVGSFFYFGTGVVFDNFSIPRIIRIVIGIAAFFTLVIIGHFSARNILISFNAYYQMVRQQNFKQLFKNHILFPLLVGNIIIFLLKIPQQGTFNYLDSLVVLCVFIPVSSSWFSLPQHQSIRFKRKNDLCILNTRLIIITVLLITLVRAGLSFGISL